LPTGFTALDWYTAGFHPGDLVICAGRPGMGKTAFALNLATNACKARGQPVLFFSLEMSKDQLARRLLCAEALVDGNKLRSARLGRGEWQQLTRAAGVVSELPLWIDDTPGITLMEMRAKARRLRAEGDLSLIVVDYLQLMRSGGKHDNREQEISEISRSLKGIAKELQIPVLALSQLNRAVESRGTKDKRPMLADLRESGAIEQDADTILFVFREEVYDPENAPQGIAEIIIGKQRAGPTGKVEVRFRPQFTRFDNIDRQHGEADAPAEPAEPANF
jgi:replicative DNA helicase